MSLEPQQEDPGISPIIRDATPIIDELLSTSEKKHIINSTTLNGLFSPIIEAKSHLSNGDQAGAFAVLKKAAESGDVMACYDAGFMMIQGIGCDVDCYGGLELMSKGMEFEGDSEYLSWKSCGSATELIEPQSMFIECEFLFMCLALDDDLNDHISSLFLHPPF